MIQPQVPLRLPCDDLALLAEFEFVLSRRIGLIQTQLGWLDGRCVQGSGTYSPLADDERLLRIPVSRGRVATLDLN